MLLTLKKRNREITYLVFVAENVERYFIKNGMRLIIHQRLVGKLFGGKRMKALKRYEKCLLLIYVMQKLGCKEMVDVEIAKRILLKG